MQHKEVTFVVFHSVPVYYQPSLPIQSIPMAQGISPSLFAFSDNPFKNNLNSKGKERKIIKNEEMEDSQYLENFRTLKISPYQVGFLPKSKWRSIKKNFSIEQLIIHYFRSKSSIKNRFEFKLWNALQISRHFTHLEYYIGVCWITPAILRVTPKSFGRFLGIKKITSALFSAKGSFTSHGFVEISEKDVMSITELCDFSQNYRYFQHANQKFMLNSTEDDLNACHWIS